MLLINTFVLPSFSRCSETMAITFKKVAFSTSARRPIISAYLIISSGGRNFSVLERIRAS